MSSSTADLIPILLIDSDHNILNQFPSLLLTKGYLVHTTNDFETARQYLQTEPIELILLELVFERDPHIESGFQFVDWLRTNSPYACIDLILSSAYYSSKYYRDIALLRYQAIAYLDRPLSEEQWFEVLDRYRDGSIFADDTLNSTTAAAISNADPSFALDPEQFLIDPQLWADSVVKSKPKKNTTTGSRRSVKRTISSSTPAPAIDVHSIQSASRDPMAQRPKTEPRQCLEQTSSSDARIQTPQNPFVLPNQTAHDSTENSLDGAAPSYESTYALLQHIQNFYNSCLQSDELLANIERQFIQIIVTEPKCERAYLYLGRFYIDQARHEAAAELYRLILKQQPQFKEVALALSQLKKQHSL
jgi:tetratricopeptide (TPR) repeat protein